MKNILKVFIGVFATLTFVGVTYAEVISVTPSTNEINKTKSWAHVNQLSKGIGETELEFVSTRPFASCFEYRTDGDTNQVIGVNSNITITDGLYPYFCVNNSTRVERIKAKEYVEIRMVFGAERDERFDWTRFEVLQKTGKVDVCHKEGKKGVFHLINISDNALKAHLDHGDGVPGTLVPGREDKKFTKDCSVTDRWKEIETVSVPANNSSGVSSQDNLEKGKEYKLEATGTYKFANWGEYGIADAKFNYRSAAHNGGYPGWVDGSTFPGSLQYYLQVKANGGPLYWIEDYNDAHTYTASFTGDGNVIHFNILDDQYGDNSGNIQVKIFADL